MGIQNQIRKAFGDGYMEGYRDGSRKGAYEEQKYADMYSGESKNTMEPTSWMYSLPPNEKYPFPHDQSWSLTKRYDLPGYIETPLYPWE